MNRDSSLARAIIDELTPPPRDPKEPECQRVLREFRESVTDLEVWSNWYPVDAGSRFSWHMIQIGAMGVGVIATETGEQGAADEMVVARRAIQRAREIIERCRRKVDAAPCMRCGAEGPHSAEEWGARGKGPICEACRDSLTNSGDEGQAHDA